MVDIRESRADRVSSFKRRYRRRTKRSERLGGKEKSRVDQARRPGEGKRNQDLAEKEATLCNVVYKKNEGPITIDKDSSF